MQNYHPKERGHAKVLARRYFRTDKPWSQFQLAEGDPLSNIQQYDIKLKNFLDEHGKDPKKGVSVEEALIGIGCPKPWYREENEIYSFVLRKLSDWYNRRYLQVLSEQLKPGDPSQIIDSGISSFRRGPHRKPPSDSWHPFS